MEKTISFRPRNQWFRDFSDYLTKNGLSRSLVFEDLLTALFVAMSDEQLRDFTVKGKYDHAMKRLNNKVQQH